MTPRSRSALRLSKIQAYLQDDPSLPPCEADRSSRSISPFEIPSHVWIRCPAVVDFPFVDILRANNNCINYNNLGKIRTKMFTLFMSVGD